VLFDLVYICCWLLFKQGRSCCKCLKLHSIKRSYFSERFLNTEKSYDINSRLIRIVHFKWKAWLIDIFDKTTLIHISCAFSSLESVSYRLSFKQPCYKYSAHIAIKYITFLYKWSEITNCCITLIPLSFTVFWQASWLTRSTE